MQGIRPAGVLVFLAALLIVAFAAPAAPTAAYSGRVVSSHAAAGARASAHLDAASTSAKRMEDEVAPEMMTWAASLAQGQGGGDSSGLDQSNAVCLPKCSKPGRPYTGRGCQSLYGCPTAPTQSNS